MRWSLARFTGRALKGTLRALPVSAIQQEARMFREFREFIMRGNVIDLAVAVVIGAAFGAVITSFVGDILTPLLGVVGVPNFGDLTIAVGKATIKYGLFLNALISFILIAAAIFFFVIKPMNTLEARRQAGVVETPTTKTCTECATEIPLTARRCPNCTQPQAA
jgi:large conductance mechanosensitive channel